jgi:glycosyltransferase involved in cell wall biosynthesis
MRLLFVVQRYGTEVAGGAEAHCREFATRLAARGHHVEALTSCATDYLHWANEYAPGDEELEGVIVHRLPVARERDWRYFGPLDARTVWGTKPVPLYLQTEWMRRQGPDLPNLVPWLTDNAPDFDVVVFFTYLYQTTWAGLPAAAGLAPTVLHPTAHEEPMLSLSIFDTTFRLPTAFAFSTEEESALIRRRFGVRRIESVIGVGVDLDPPSPDRAFLDRFPQLAGRPFLLYVGRVDPNKGVGELCEYFAVYKERNPGPLALVLLGQAASDVATGPDVITTGFVDDAVRWSAMHAATALVQPSYFESFSMVLAEAWAARRPALVNGRCDVLAGQVRRSGGGLPYHGFAEFESAVELLLEDPRAAAGLGAAGRDFVVARYSWDDVMARYETLLGQVASRRWGRIGAPVR